MCAPYEECFHEPGQIADFGLEVKQSNIRYLMKRPGETRAIAGSFSVYSSGKRPLAASDDAPAQLPLPASKSSAAGRMRRSVRKRVRLWHVSLARELALAYANGVFVSKKGYY
jgi:hypothetical protein